jgi:hypothetical protein
VVVAEGFESGTRALSSEVRPHYGAGSFGTDALPSTKFLSHLTISSTSYIPSLMALKLSDKSNILSASHVN